MKRVAIILCTLGVLSLSVHAQDTFLKAQQGGTPPPVSKKVVAPLEVRGKIDTITLSEPSLGIRPEIAVSGEDGKKYTFLISLPMGVAAPDYHPPASNHL